MALVNRFAISYEDVEPYIELAISGADSERDALGFLPPGAYQQAAQQGKLFIAIGNTDEYLGHLMFGGVFPHGKVIQAYSKPEVRKHGIGFALINQLVNYAQDREFLSLSAKVASDLTGANAFYERMGFHVVRTLPGGKTRNRLLYHLVRDLDTPSLFDLMLPKANVMFQTLKISGGYSSSTPIYAIDLNVLFDVGKRRMRSENAGMVFKAGFRNDIRPVIAQEFIEELQRTSQQFSNDPYLQLALQMNVLPKPKAKDIESIEKRLAAKIFPERFDQNTLTIRDKSDIRHIATAVHHNVKGFITSENAILRAHDFISSEYGFDVLGVSDFADTVSSNISETELDRIARIDETELISNPMTAEFRQQSEAFLKQLHVPPNIMDNALSQGDAIAPHKHVILSDESGMISFASWSLKPNPRLTADVFLCADENKPTASTVIEHTLERICRSACSNVPARVCLKILPGHPITRKVALAYGFRPEPGKEQHGTTLHKVATGCTFDAANWDSLRRTLRGLIDVELPSKIPKYKAQDQLIKIKTPSGEDIQIPLFELETLLSPALIVLPGRPGTIVSIKSVFADELLETAQQFSLLTPPEAVLLKERVYYNTPRAASALTPGTPILFYETSHNKGRKSIVALGRATKSYMLTGGQLNLDIKRRGVLNSDTMKYIGNSEAKLVTAFDNIMVFRKPVTLVRLREMGCADGANFITAKRIEPHHLATIINEGLNDA